MDTETQLVWLKRDLRLSDHAALTGALAAGPAVGLYVFEDGWLSHPDTDGSHVAFVLESLRELRAQWKKRGGMLFVRRGDVVEVLRELHDQIGFARLWSHEETGNAWSFERDKAVGAFCAERSIPWEEPWQTGVQRRMKTRDGWSRRWQQRMKAEIHPVPDAIPAPTAVNLKVGRLPGLKRLIASPSPRQDVQAAGEKAAFDTLDSFLKRRSVNYRADMSTPVEGWEGCSRLSPYLAYGNISIRTVFQATAARSAELKEARKNGETFPSTWLPSLASFRSRLSWHCHFMQKLEDEPDLETVPMNRAFIGFNDDNRCEKKLLAFTEGRTGYPMFDACMRCLHETGWINFRMRAMLTSFGCHHLAQPWTDIGRILAPMFLDFEAGIHYSQTQMQAGVTGINTLRIYSPAKQVTDQDPEGVFIRRWVPELKDVPSRFLPEPHTMPPKVQKECRCVIGKDYPAPLVDHGDSSTSARQRNYAVRRTDFAKAEAERVLKKHGSRKRQPKRRPKRSKKSASNRS